MAEVAMQKWCCEACCNSPVNQCKTITTLNVPFCKHQGWHACRHQGFFNSRCFLLFHAAIVQTLFGPTVFGTSAASVACSCLCGTVKLDRWLPLCLSFHEFVI